MRLMFGFARSLVLRVRVMWENSVVSGPGLFPGKIAATVFSVKIESEVFSHGEGTKLNLGFFILKFRLRIDLVKIDGFKAKFAISC